MKKTLLLLTTLFVFVAFVSNAQITNGGFESWTAANPDGWGGSKTATTGLTITKVTTNVHGGVNACGLTNTTTAHKRFTSLASTVTSGTAYVISFWVRGTTGQVRTGMYTGAANSGYGYIGYNAYVSVTSTWAQVTQTLVPDTSTSLAEFIIDAGTSADIVIDDVTVTQGTVTNVSIHDIQYSTTAPFVSAFNGQPVITGGIVSAKYNRGFFIQDASGPWNGVYVYDSAHAAAAGIVRGDSVTLSGTVSEYLTYTEIGSLSALTKVSSNTVHPAYSVTKANSTTEELEGVLVTLTNIPCVDATGAATYGEWTVYNGTDSTKIGGLLYKYTTATVGTNYNITGVVYLAYGGVVRVEPRDASDITVSTGINDIEKNSVSIYPNPVSSTLFLNNIEGTQIIRISNILGETVQSNKVSGNFTTINVNKLSNGVYFISLIDVNGVANTRKFIKN